MSTSEEIAEQNIALWKVSNHTKLTLDTDWQGTNSKMRNTFQLKKLVHSLRTARGAGTSMISLIIPPRTQISVSTVSETTAQLAVFFFARPFADDPLPGGMI